MSTDRKARFRPAAGGTLPNADEALDVTTPGRQDAVTPVRTGIAPGGRIAYTWRLTADQALALDDMMLRLKRQLGRPKLDRAEMLAALVDLAAENPGVFGALVARMQAE